MAVKLSSRLAIHVHASGEYSQTFVRQHIDELAEDRLVLMGVPPSSILGERLFFPQDIISRMSRKVRRRLLGSKRFADYSRCTVANALVKRSVDVLIAEFGPVGAAVWPITCRAYVPLVVHFHGYDAYQHDVVKHNREPYIQMFAACHAVIAVSQDMKKQLISLGAPEEKVRLIPYGVDLDQFSSGFPTTAKPNLLAIGRFVDKKAPHLTLLAFSRVAERYPEARLAMAGDGPLQGACVDLARALGIADRVDFPGVLNHEQVSTAMRNARMFVQHSIRAQNGDSEGSPVAVIEASASGLPVVATRHAGIKESVVEGETGILVYERDVEGMAAGMARLLEDSELAGRMGAAGRRHVEANYDATQQLAKLRSVLEEAAASRRKS